METDRAGGDRENKECIPSTSSTPSKQASTTAHKDVEEKVREDEMKEANTRIFSLTPVNSYGSSDSGVRLEDNDKPLKLTSELCVFNFLFFFIFFQVLICNFLTVCIFHSCIYSCFPGWQ